MFILANIYILILSVYDMDRNKLALERIEHLFKEADLVFKENPKRADKYVSIARKIATKINLKLPKDIKRKFCKHCYSYLKPGINSRIRNYKSRVTIYCSNCKKFTRIPLS